MDWERFLENEDLKSIRAALKMTKPDDFEYIVDKTICLTKGISLKTFQAYKDDVKEKLRKKVDPDESLRKMNKETLQQVEKHRQELRLLYFEKLTDAIVGESRTSGSGQPRDPRMARRVRPLVRPAPHPDPRNKRQVQQAAWRQR